MVSYIKTQWFRLLLAVFCLVMACIYAFQPTGDPTTLEGLNQNLGNMVSVGIYFTGFILWSCISFVDYNTRCIQLLEKKAEKYDALCEEVSALTEANRIDREYMHRLEQRIQQIKYDIEN